MTAMRAVNREYDRAVLQFEAAVDHWHSNSISSAAETLRSGGGELRSSDCLLTAVPVLAGPRRDVRKLEVVCQYGHRGSTPRRCDQCRRLILAHAC